MKTHTPGPWCVNGPTIAGGADACGIPLPLAHVLNPYSGASGAADRIAANAALIAAAPELLAALQALTAACENEGFPYLGRILPKARAAIARAVNP